MSRMSEVHNDLASIHAILLGQRKVATNHKKNLYMGGSNDFIEVNARINCINNLLLEFEAAGVVWPDNVVSIGHD